MTDKEDPRSLISGITERGHHLVSPSFLNGSIRGPNYRGETDPPITPNYKGENPFIIPQKAKENSLRRKTKSKKSKHKKLLEEKKRLSQYKGGKNFPL